MLGLLAVLLFFAAFFLLLLGAPRMRGPERPALPWRIVYVTSVAALLLSAGLAARADIAHCSADPNANDCDTTDPAHH
ncbi:hypothetical protein Sipo8835_37390 [Streptomyces ipomoeae]|uniref:Uncharacterized protein n=2 Tax=Streptomyces ipomoeae TaxID=103232 RepID=L1L9D8_9ACTN|nr:hypothetical protein [Streptomyces ipomoeae]EKX69305.1 hypothetical protein STRIP9103_04261 [Streptomyces ipomoeae 91-03]MDX2701171.1 hypothetical protein [Streptomyces ipomoeae]MDX2846809.1 hypothetical protein [Streptomyces ipomoeae]MDX2933004.1 hypothetical protein [Streptomyces ipomoeae]TQE16512.1 hypothetical protein SipoB123_40435 [Streptomyces ipomoeae]